LERARASAAGAFLAPGFFVGAGHVADILGAGGSHSLSGLVRDHRVMDGLGSLSVFNERELHFVFALAFSFDVYDGDFHVR